MASATKNGRTEEQRIAAVRAFNRFYPLKVGLLSPGYLHSSFSITEARVIHAIATRGEAEVADLRRELGLDAGYLSRMLNRFEEEGLIARGRSRADRRRQLVKLTAKGRRTFASLDRRSSAEIGSVLRAHSGEQQRRLVEAMGSIRRILGEQLERRRMTIREIEPGDHGWVLERHAHLYDDELGWPPEFEALVARIVADFLTEHDPKRERGWIGELDGERAGAVYCVRKSDDVAQLRLLFVEDWARGVEVGRKLVDRCIRFARSKGYERMILWTNSSLESARRIYDAAGFEQIGEEPHPVFPEGTVGQELRLDL
jgi:DNA-binding MarR family transcriptional regulator/N-acetylglutamate synthase-like GNAT family acetyltransferase